MIIQAMKHIEDGDTKHLNKLKELVLFYWEYKDNVFAVFDDRNQVVDMWRSNGLTCFQVADGDF